MKSVLDRFLSVVFGLAVITTILACLYVSSLLAYADDGLAIVGANMSQKQASWYSTEACKYNPDPDCPTADGSSLYELEAGGELFAAAWDYPFGTKLKVTNVANGKSVVVSVLDRGPNRRLDRAIDLGRLAFSQIADPKVGLINVEIVKL